MILIRLFCGKSKAYRDGIARKSSPSLLIVLSLIILSIAIYSSHAAEIESAIPAYSAAHIVVKDVLKIWDAVKTSPSWQAFLSSEKLGSRMQKIKTGMEFLGVDLRTLVEVFGHRIAFVEIDPKAPGLPTIIADVGNSKGASEIIWSIEQTLGSNEEYGLKPGAGKYLTTPFGLVSRSGGKVTFRYAFLDNLFVLAPGQDAFEAVVDTYLGGRPSLIYDPKFNKMRAAVFADGELFVYVNLEALWPMVWDSEWSVGLQMLSEHGIKSIAWTTNLLATNRDQELYIYTGDSRGLLASLFAESKPLLSHHLIPAVDADIFFVMHPGDPAAVWETISRNFAMQGDISEFERATGLSLKNDILSSLTGEIGFAMSFPEAMKFAEDFGSILQNGLMIFCGVKDREKCAMSIERILSAAGIPLQQMEYRGATVYQIPFLSGPEVPVGYMFAGDLLILGNFQKLKDLINEEPPLVVSEKFAEANSRLPQQSGLLCCVDLGKAGQLLLKANPGGQPEDDMAHLQNLGSICVAVVYDGEGLKAKAVGTPGKGWLETIGDLAELLIRVSSLPLWPSRALY